MVCIYQLAVPQALTPITPLTKQYICLPALLQQGTAATKQSCRLIHPYRISSFQDKMANEPRVISRTSLLKEASVIIKGCIRRARVSLWAICEVTSQLVWQITGSVVIPSGWLDGRCSNKAVFAHSCSVSLFFIYIYICTHLQMPLSCITIKIQLPADAEKWLSFGSVCFAHLFPFCHS